MAEKDRAISMTFLRISTFKKSTPGVLCNKIHRDSSIKFCHSLSHNFFKKDQQTVTQQFFHQMNTPEIDPCHPEVDKLSVQSQKKDLVNTKTTDLL